MRITKCDLKNKSSLEFGDINVFVGPNGAGKTTLLNEIREFFCDNRSSTNYWVSKTEDDGLHNEDAKILLDHTSERCEIDDNGQKIKKYRIKHSKNKNGKYEDNEKSEEYPEQIYQQILSLSQSKKKDKIDLQNPYFIKPLFVGHENTRGRLNLNGNYPRNDTAQSLKNAVNVVMNDESFQKKINNAFEEVFGRSLIFTDYRGGLIEILVGDFNDNKNDSAIKKLKETLGLEEQEKIKEKNNLLAIDRVGDGMRAAANLFLSLFDIKSKIIFIDEPETFIHPKQKRKIAEQLRELTKGNQGRKQLFFSTHDANFLSGLVDKKDKQIDIKIFYVKDHNNVINISNYSVGDEKIKPSTKYPKYLQSLFYDATIFVEGPNDRYFYENSINEIYKEDLKNKDVLFTDFDGASKWIQVSKFIKNSEIEAVFIFDKEIIQPSKQKNGQQQRIPALYKELGGTADLNKMINKTQEVAIIAELKKFGIFIVPVGELQDWIKLKNCPKFKKNDHGFPYNLTEKMSENPTNKFKSFATSILEFLKVRNKKVKK